MTDAPASTRARLAQIAPLDSGAEHPAMGLARHLACMAHYRDALITALPPPAAPAAVNLRNYALAAVHALRVLMYACQNPEALTPELADRAAREIATAWRDGEVGDWTWMHCTALGLDPDEIAALAEGNARRMAANGAEGNGDGPAGEAGGERAPETAAGLSAHWQHIADERLGKLATIARIGAEPPDAVLAIIQDRAPDPRAGTSETATMYHESVTEFRRGLVQDAEHWRSVKERYSQLRHGRALSEVPREAADAYVAALMAYQYGYVLAAILRGAEKHMGPQTARLLADFADDLLANGDEHDLNADVKPGTPLPPPTPAEQAAAGQLVLPGVIP